MIVLIRECYMYPHDKKYICVNVCFYLNKYMCPLGLNPNPFTNSVICKKITANAVRINQYNNNQSLNLFPVTSL